MLTYFDMDSWPVVLELKENLSSSIVYIVLHVKQIGHFGKQSVAYTSANTLPFIH